MMVEGPVAGVAVGIPVARHIVAVGVEVGDFAEAVVEAGLDSIVVVGGEGRTADAADTVAAGEAEPRTAEKPLSRNPEVEEE